MPSRMSAIDSHGTWCSRRRREERLEQPGPAHPFAIESEPRAERAASHDEVVDPERRSERPERSVRRRRVARRGRGRACGRRRRRPRTRAGHSGAWPAPGMWSMMRVADPCARPGWSRARLAATVSRTWLPISSTSVERHARRDAPRRRAARRATSSHRPSRPSRRSRERAGAGEDRGDHRRPAVGLSSSSRSSTLPAIHPSGSRIWWSRRWSPARSSPSGTWPLMIPPS